MLNSVFESITHTYRLSEYADRRPGTEADGSFKFQLLARVSVIIQTANAELTATTYSASLAAAQRHWRPAGSAPAGRRGERASRRELPPSRLRSPASARRAAPPAKGGGGDWPALHHLLEALGAGRGAQRMQAGLQKY